MAIEGVITSFDGPPRALPRARSGSVLVHAVHGGAPVTKYRGGLEHGTGARASDLAGIVTTVPF